MASDSNGVHAGVYAVCEDDVHAAHARIRKHVHKTPVITCAAVDSMASDPTSDREAFFKCELFQKSGSFKARGACNAVFQLDPQTASKGVCTHSSGNHAQALAVAAKMLGIPAYIVMPSNAPAIKKRAVAGYGAQIFDCEPTQAAREAAAGKVEAETGAKFVHPSEDPAVIAGQGTIALELLPQVAELLGLDNASRLDSLKDLPSPVLDAVIVPIGGGGMISGVATAIKALDPRIKVIAAEPLEANDAFRSKQEGSMQGNPTPPHTVADGLKTTLGPNTWPIVRDKVDVVVCVSETQIIDAMRIVYERMKLAIEPSAAVGVAVLLSDEVKKIEGLKRFGVILCGGNTDVDKLPFAK